MRLLLDADATIALRKLSLWTLILASEVELVMTEHIARHELSSLSQELTELETRRRIEVHRILTKPVDNEANVLRKELHRAGADKGEAEAIAWAATLGGEKPIFVSVDARARVYASEQNLDAADLGDLAALLILERVLDQEDVEDKVRVWDDSTQQQGRPKDWKGLSISLPERLRRFAMR